MKSFEIRDDEFLMNDYNARKPFASFLPGIAGPWGKPLWAYYVNRGQCISSLGVNSKNGPITEFVAANKAYRQTALQGFRTFVKARRGARALFHEPFRHHPEGGVRQSLAIRPDSIAISESHPASALSFRVRYFTLPNDVIPSLVRLLTITNDGATPVTIEALDGLPVIQPYGMNDSMLKNMSRLAEGWFSGTRRTKAGATLYKLQTGTDDTSEIAGVVGTNFYFGFLAGRSAGRGVPCVVEADDIFGPCVDFSHPAHFFRSGTFRFDRALESRNKSACAFGFFRRTLPAGGSLTFASLIGATTDIAGLDAVLRRLARPGVLESKAAENRLLIAGITDRIQTVSADPAFDSYVRQTYLDNVLRGGLPVSLPAGKRTEVAYIYSRIHGDMEREYNPFEIQPTPFSQGTGNYRDVAQNRRCDAAFNPDASALNLRTFYNLLQLDGFNPLKVREVRYTVVAPSILRRISPDRRLLEFTKKPFTLGGFFLFLETRGIRSRLSREKILETILSASRSRQDSEFEHGYWTDHWHYNIDFLDFHRAVFPDRFTKELFHERAYHFHDTAVFVKPRSRKYVLMGGIPRQNDPLEIDKAKKALMAERGGTEHGVRTRRGRGPVYKTTLLVKLLDLVAQKYASLDARGVGIEMESEKPNWCDALNGLSALFGSSTCETHELKRLVDFLASELESAAPMVVRMPEEIAALWKRLADASARLPQGMDFWDETHTAKEAFREETRMGLTGREVPVPSARIARDLAVFSRRLARGLARAVDPRTGLPQGYFINEVVSWKVLGGRSDKGHPLVRPLKFRAKPLPLYLEGVVHSLKDPAVDPRRTLAAVKRSGLYDRALRMYKVNEPLGDTTIEIGRQKVFTRGWLENESIWLHMEYKFLLEFLKRGCYDEFYREARSCLVPGMDPERYGRSPYENSSFIVSSAHPDRRLWGNGFVSRLSGATAELVNMWFLMTTGGRPFRLDDRGRLAFALEPALEARLFTRKSRSVDFADGRRLDLTPGSFLFVLLGRTPVVLRNPSRRKTFGRGRVTPRRYTLKMENGRTFVVEGASVPAPLAEAVRNGEIRQIVVDLA